MRLALLTLSALLLMANPALAQHAGHDMGDMAEPEPTPAAPPTNAPAPTSPAPPAEEEVMDAPAWPTNPPPMPEGDGAMAGMDHSGMGAIDNGPVGNEAAPEAPTDFAAERFYDRSTMEEAREQLKREHGGNRVGSFMINLGEWQFRDGEGGYRWDAEGWYGGDINRFVFKTKGAGRQGAGVTDAEVQGLYSRAISPYFDIQAGLRQDIRRGPNRTYAVVGFEGLAPYWFETAGALFLSTEGELLGRLEGTYDLRLTQRWILQPRAEINLSAQGIPELELGDGVTDLELGLRLRYDINRQLAPYVGVSYERLVGGTADMARARGDRVESTSIVVGIRAWF